MEFSNRNQNFVMQGGARLNSALEVFSFAGYELEQKSARFEFLEVVKLGDGITPADYL